MPIFYFLACPLPLGLSDGRIRDEQLSASSELDDIHAAKQGRVSLIIPSKNRYRAADREARFNCDECRTKKKFTTSKKLTFGIYLNAARVSTVLIVHPNFRSILFNLIRTAGFVAGLQFYLSS